MPHGLKVRTPPAMPWVLKPGKTAPTASLMFPPGPTIETGDDGMLNFKP
eukprot:CAMPEP_0184650814 /NCGR_PEP_ID=MMETSP0308-20130426/8380_1 /TAXON_ID=38269 /ORGANISM="Gloeochaete witrockiana, Strain SAG 46.84" /LENGTH=48 /DNA_ID= /DNA_START= /DNA_END= /DNA_ORIENTATION=